VKNELERMRNWAAARLRSGAVPDQSWPQHVRLIEALDDMLHDISVAENTPPPPRYTGRALRLVRADHQRAPGARPRTKGKSAALH
jgi:hypothetical protein